MIIMPISIARSGMYGSPGIKGAIKAKSDITESKMAKIASLQPLRLWLIV